MACHSDEESGIFRALAMGSLQNTEDAPDSSRISEALKLRQKMNPSMRRSVPILSPRHVPNMYEDNEEDDDDEEAVKAPVKAGAENNEPNVKSGVASVTRQAGTVKQDVKMGGRKALLARLNLGKNAPQKVEKSGMSSTQFQNQLSSRFKTTKHQVRRLASSDNDE